MQTDRAHMGRTAAPNVPTTVHAVSLTAPTNPLIALDVRDTAIIEPMTGRRVHRVATIASLIEPRVLF